MSGIENIPIPSENGDSDDGIGLSIQQKAGRVDYSKESSVSGSAAISDKELIDIQKNILKLQSFDPLKSEVPQFITKILKRYGIKPRLINSNGFISIVAKTKGKPRVLFNGHWDTVLPSEKYNKTTQLIKEDDEYIYGLGACDMKGGVVAIIGAFIEAYVNKIEGVQLCLVPDEELGGTNGTKILIEKGIVAPNVVICEPTNLSTSLGQKGSLATKIISRGISAHGAYPQRGENAISKMFIFNQILSETFPLPDKSITPDDAFNIVTASLNLINGGTAGNVIPEICSAYVDIRVPPRIKLSEVRNTIQKIAQKADVEVIFEQSGIGWEINKLSELFKVSVKALNDTGIVSPDFVRKMGSNDGRYYVNEGCNIINIGPGDNKLSHTENEKLSKKELIQAKNIYFLISKNI